MLKEHPNLDAVAEHGKMHGETLAELLVCERVAVEWASLKARMFYRQYCDAEDVFIDQALTAYYEATTKEYR